MIFVTGGTGVLGSQLLVDLANDNQMIRALYRSDRKKDQTLSVFRQLLGDQAESKWQNIDWVVGDVLDIESLMDHMKSCRTVYHCAAIVSFHRKDFDRMIKVNRQGTANVVNVALHYKYSKICHVSSTAAIGLGSDDKLSEKTPWKISPQTTGYAHSKYASEKEVWRGHEEGLDCVIVNPCVILGAGNWSDSSLTLFKAIQKGARFYPPGSNAVVDARDVSEIMIRLMNSEIVGERYLCIGSNQSFQVLMSAIADKMGRRKPTWRARKWMVSAGRRVMAIMLGLMGKRSAITKETVWALFGHREYDNSKVKQALDYEFKSLDKTIEFSIQNRIS